MRIWTIGVVAFAFGLIALTSVRAADKPQDLIVGKWMMGKADTESTTLEFGKNGSLKVLVKTPKEKFEIGGTYKFIDDANMEVTIEFMGQKKTEKLAVKVTKDELVTIDEGKKEEKFTRVK